MNSGMPLMKVREEGEEIVVQVHISGVDEKNIRLEVKDDLLNINISKSSEKKIEDGYVGNEWMESSFDGVVSLPSKVIPMLVHHSYDGKVLEVRLKKV